MTRFFGLAVTVLLAAAPHAQAWQPVLTGGGIAPAMHGVWQSRGYGWVLTVPADGPPLVYDVGPAGCLRDDETTDALGDGIGLFTLAGDVLRIGLFPENTTRYTFDRLAGLPASCATPPGDSPREVFDYAWAVMDQHFAFFDLYGIDWHARYHAVAPTVSDTMSEDGLRRALLALLESVDDGHLSLSWEIDGEEDDYSARPPDVLRAALRGAFAQQDEIASIGAFGNRWFFDNRTRIRDGLLGGAFEVASGGNVFWGRIGEVGYLNIAGMGGFADDDDAAFMDELAAVHEVIGRAVTDLADTKAMIVDVALNQGGYDDVSLAVAGHFATDTTHAITKHAHTAEDATRQTLAVVPAAPHYLKPVVVLTSDVTVSAAETFTLQMRALPTVTHVGETTRGALSDVLFRPLPNGWVLTFSNEVYLDAEGELWEGRGIAPDEPMTLFAAGDIHGHLNAIRTLATRLAASER